MLELELLAREDEELGRGGAWGRRGGGGGGGGGRAAAVQARAVGAALDRDLGRVVDRTGAVTDGEGDLGARGDVDVPGVAVTGLGGEGDEGSRRGLATGEDADEVRSRAAGPGDKSGLALDQGCRGLDDGDSTLGDGGTDGRGDSEGGSEELHGSGVVSKVY